MPCKMELKIKDYEKFKGYYCGLCKSIKKSFGQLPRLSLNYDMTFLAILLDSITDNKLCFKRQRCALHPVKKRLTIINNNALDYAALCNVVLMYYKLLDNIKDDNSKTSKVFSTILNLYINNKINSKHADKLNELKIYIERSLVSLSKLENSKDSLGLDEISHPFADLTGHMISYYVDYMNLQPEPSIKNTLYWLGYNLGKWIYIIDAFDDLKKDFEHNRYNAINFVYNKDNLSYENFSKKIEKRIDMILVTCGSECLENLNKIDIYKNKDLLYNILQFGLMEKMDVVFKRRSEIKNAESL